jgi:hypothetical protein
VNGLRRHPLAVVLVGLILVAALQPLPQLLDAVTGAPPGDASLVKPCWYLVLAPLSNVLDALTFLSLARAKILVGTWLAGLALAGALTGRGWRSRITRGVGYPLLLVLLAAAAVLLPRPVPYLVSGDPDGTVVDFHAHTEASHDGRHGWSADDLARWHAAQGFQASYVTDHNAVFNRHVVSPINLLPGAEWSVYGQHVVALGEMEPLDPALYSRDTKAMLGIFAGLHALNALAIASIPEYWENHRNDLGLFVAEGVDGFEIVNCAPKAIGFTPMARAEVVGLARSHDLLVTGASDNHGWGKVTCVWNVSHPESHGFTANHIFARPLALAQGTSPAWTAAFTQPWLMLRGLDIAERVSWLTWIVLWSIYRSVPRRHGQPGGLGILARRLTVGRRGDPPA